MQFIDKKIYGRFTHEGGGLCGWRCAMGHSEVTMFEWKRFFPKATSAQLERFERASDLSLPERYKNYLLSSNGGQPSNEVYFALPENREEVMLGVLFGVSDEDDNALSLEVVY